MFRKKILALSILFTWLSAAHSQKTYFTSNDYIRALKHATDVMVNDATSPVAASRYYAYINLSANETVTLFDKQHPGFAGKIKGLNAITIDD